MALTAKHAEVVAQGGRVHPAAVAICFLHSFTNPAHEQQLAAAVRAAMPGTPVVTSTETWPEMREYERAMTTLICAYVAPVMAGYLAGLRERLRRSASHCPIEIMDSSGGAMSEQLASRLPVHTVESGGAAGVTAAGFLGQLLGLETVISFDMGGTTAKTGIVRGGHPDLTHDFQVGGKGSFGGSRPGTGFPVKIPVVDLAEVGAGGGSVAWVDVGGALRVGPHSAGADPRPGLLRPGRDRADGHRRQPGARLSRHRPGRQRPQPSDGPGRRGHRARRRRPLGLTVPEAAWAIHDIVNANMAAAIRVVTIQRGIDPRSFNLVGFGGAGPMHAPAWPTLRDHPGGGALGRRGGFRGRAISADPSVEWRRPLRRRPGHPRCHRAGARLRRARTAASRGDRSRWQRPRRSWSSGSSGCASGARCTALEIPVATRREGAVGRHAPRRLRRALRRGVRRGARIPAPTDLAGVRRRP